VAYSLDQPAGNITIRVVREGGVDLPLNLSYETVQVPSPVLHHFGVRVSGFAFGSWGTLGFIALNKCN